MDKSKFEEFVKKEFGEDRPFWYGEDLMAIKAGSGANHSIDDLHYEYCNGKVSLHIEGDSWWIYRNIVRNKLSQSTDLLPSVWWKRQDCQWNLVIKDEDIFGMFKKIRNVIDPLLDTDKTEPVPTIGEDDVTYVTRGLNIYDWNLNIPDYQRIYAWETSHVRTLIDDIANNTLDNYYIGTIVLHHRKGENDVYDIVDGQQRLVTLALILYCINPSEIEKWGVKKFLECKYLSTSAQKHIRDNYDFIRKYLSEDKKRKLEENIGNLLFSVLCINDSNKLDLAFTFFTSTNSKGVRLSDYDLLKPHHLRFIPSELEKQQAHLAKQWDYMINIGREKNANRLDIDYIRLLELCLYRLRQWTFFNSAKYPRDHYIKKEFESSITVDEIPPFGEKFKYYEPIQGGQHFFAYVDYFIQKYRKFEVKDLIRKYFGHESSSSWYGNVIEALSFCYYLKFGESYLNEATLSIIRYVAALRFATRRAYEPTILEQVNQSKFITLINTASSPTFVLATMEKAIVDSANFDRQNIEKEKGVRAQFYNSCEQISKVLSANVITNSYKNYFNNRYE